MLRNVRSQESSIMSWIVEGMAYETGRGTIYPPILNSGRSQLYGSIALSHLTISMPGARISISKHVPQLER